MSFDNPIVKLVSAETVLEVYEALYPLEGNRYIFLDEIPYTDNWELWMKVIYDSRKDIRLTATGSASPVLEKGTADSGTGRWSVLKIPTLSFFEYCRLLRLTEIPNLPENQQLTEMVNMTTSELGDLMSRFEPLTRHFNRYNRKEVDAVVELPRQKLLCEVKYRNNTHLSNKDAIVELCAAKDSGVTQAFLITKRLDDFGVTKHETEIPIMRVPTLVFLYMIGKAEAEGRNGNL
ncbi:MAG: AAA family ATPase [Lachnospiraceae bacterium]|nr:AAA family ATPase [Lachnospiraceae bacterium]